MLESVEWGEYRLGDLFEIENTFSFNKDALTSGDEYDYVTRTSQNQGILQSTGFVNIENINGAGTWSLGLLQMDFFYRKRQWYAGQFVRKIVPKISLTDSSISFFTTILNKQKQVLLSVLVRDVDEVFRNTTCLLPTRERKIDYEFMERFIAELNAARLAELNAYLTITGLNDYTLTTEEEQAVRDFEDGNVEWGKYRLGDLFGEATRGKRLKSEDRISGNLPFVTAGEADMGVSAFIGNEVEVFQPNTITIDMFGSAKYRNYTYGADDHVAVVHTQSLSKYAVLFITSAIHKVANSGDFHYGRNFYAKDAAPLIVSLFDWQGSPDYGRMETFISAIQKLVIKDVVLYADREIEATKRAIDKTSKSKVVSQKGSIPKSV